MNFSLPEMTSDAEMKFPFADKLQLSKLPSVACRSGVGQIQLSMLHLLPAVRAGSPSRGGNVAVDVFDINQPSLTTPFYSVLVSISVFTALSTVFHFINLPMTVRFLTLFLRSYICLIGPFNFISFYESLLQP